MTMRLLILAGSLLAIASTGLADPDEIRIAPPGARAIYLDCTAAGGVGEAPLFDSEEEEGAALRAVATPVLQANFSGHTEPPAVPRSRRRAGLFASAETEGMVQAIGVSSTTALLLALIPIVMLVVALWSMGVAARAERQAPVG